MPLRRREEMAQIEIRDTGRGIAPEHRQRIFQLFFTTRAGGSGIGLAISRTIVESHGGRLWAAANDGRGTTFYFTLPIHVIVITLDYLFFWELGILGFGPQKDRNIGIGIFPNLKKFFVGLAS